SGWRSSGWGSSPPAHCTSGTRTRTSRELRRSECDSRRRRWRRHSRTGRRDRPAQRQTHRVGDPGRGSRAARVREPRRRGEAAEGRRLPVLDRGGRARPVRDHPRRRPGNRPAGLVAASPAPASRVGADAGGGRARLPRRVRDERGRLGVRRSGARTGAHADELGLESRRPVRRQLRGLRRCRAVRRGVDVPRAGLLPARAAGTADGDPLGRGRVRPRARAPGGAADPDRVRLRARLAARALGQRVSGHGRTRDLQRSCPDRRRLHLAGDPGRMSKLTAVRRALPLALLLLVWPSPAGAATPTLTLKAPRATTYLHQIDFAGRMSPTAPGARVRLVRGTSTVATTRVRGDGSFLFKVELANPGPFHVAWLSARSNDVTIRIRPRLRASLVGTPVVGASLKLAATLDPSAAGRVRVQVIRGGEVGFDRSFPGGARVALGTRETGTLRVRLTTLPRPGFDPVSRELTTTLRPPYLSVGTASPTVAELAHRLAA